MGTHDRADRRPPGEACGLRQRAAIEFVLDNLVWFILVVVLGAFSLLIPNFLQIGILLNILEQSTFVGIIAVGLSLTLIAGHMDLSIESVLALVGDGGGADLRHAWRRRRLRRSSRNGWRCRSRSPIALAIGIAVGASNAFLVVQFGINAFIVTLASYIWVRGLVVALSGGRSVYGLPDSMRHRRHPAAVSACRSSPGC